MGNDIVELLRPTIEGMGFELLGIEQARSRDSSLLRIYIDSEQGITVTDCERVSRQVSDVLEVERPRDADATLEVSSPGMDRPLFTLAQFARFVGEEVRVSLRMPIDGRKRIKGRLVAADESGIAVAEEGETYRFPFEAVERARLVPQW